MQGGSAPTAAIGVCLIRVRDVSPLVLLVKVGLKEGKMFGTEETKDRKDYDLPEMYTRTQSVPRSKSTPSRL